MFEILNHGKGGFDWKHLVIGAYLDFVIWSLDFEKCLWYQNINYY
jgi:hypothetical protein